MQINKSAMIVALFVLPILLLIQAFVNGAPLSPSIHLAGEGLIEGYGSIDYIQTESAFIKETFKIRTGISRRTNIYFFTSLMQSGVHELSNTTIGDSGIGLWHGFGFLFEDFSLGLLIEVGLPTAPNALNNESLFITENGYTTLTVGLAGGFAHDSILLLYSGLYVMMPESGRSVFDGLSLNVTDSKTWKNIFGLNPVKQDSMVYHEKLTNDIATFALTAVYDILPSIVYISGLAGNRLNNKAQYSQHGSPVLYKGYAKTLFFVVSSGVRYFFNEKTYIGSGVLFNIKRDYNHSLRYAVSVEASSIW